MMEKERKGFTNFSIFSYNMFAHHDICDHDLMQEIRIVAQLLFLFPDKVFKTMKLLAKVKVGKNMIKSHIKSPID